MTLGNMRQNGVRSLAITCGALHCHHEATMDVSGFADDVAVPSFGPRMACTVCGAIGADARPNWKEKRRSAAFVRKKASHAEWGQFDKEGVNATIKLTKALIERHLK